jgi:hypothetical protein
MELARARAAAASDPGVRAAALARAGDAYERARAGPRTPSGEAERPGAAEGAWRGLGRGLARLLALAPGVRGALEDRLLGAGDGD